MTSSVTSGDDGPASQVEPVASHPRSWRPGAATQHVQHDGHHHGRHERRQQERLPNHDVQNSFQTCAGLSGSPSPSLYLICGRVVTGFNTPTHIKRTNKRTNQQAKSKQASKIVMWCKHTDALSSKSVLLICPCLPTSLSAPVPLLFLSFHSPYDCLLLSQLNLFLKGQMNERLNLAKCLHYRLYKIFPRFSE